MIAANNKQLEELKYLLKVSIHNLVKINET
jgi:hypothetical protein